jgi:hypothetical protein
MKVYLQKRNLRIEKASLRNSSHRKFFGKTDLVSTKLEARRGILEILSMVKMHEFSYHSLLGRLYHRRVFVPKNETR